MSSASRPSPEGRPPLCCVGVGPGDPGLVTLAALRAMEESDVLALPGLDRESCRAWQIAAAAEPHLAEKETRCFDFPMTRDAGRLREALDAVWRETAALLRAGKRVCFLTLGDPSVYSTFAPIAERAARDGVRSAVVGGVSAFAAGAASLGIPLVNGAEELHVLPGEADFAAALRLPGTKVFMKTGRRMAELRAALLPLEAEGRVSVYAVRDSGPEEELYFGAEAIPPEIFYMTTVIVREKARTEEQTTNQ